MQKLPTTPMGAARTALTVLGIFAFAAAATAQESVSATQGQDRRDTVVERCRADGLSAAECRRRAAEHRTKAAKIKARCRNAGLSAAECREKAAGAQENRQERRQDRREAVRDRCPGQELSRAECQGRVETRRDRLPIRPPVQRRRARSQRN